MRTTLDSILFIYVIIFRIISVPPCQYNQLAYFNQINLQKGYIDASRIKNFQIQWFGKKRKKKKKKRIEKKGVVEDLKLMSSGLEHQDICLSRRTSNSSPVFHQNKHWRPPFSNHSIQVTNLKLLQTWWPIWFSETNSLCFSLKALIESVNGFWHGDRPPNRYWRRICLQNKYFFLFCLLPTSAFSIHYLTIWTNLTQYQNVMY